MSGSDEPSAAGAVLTAAPPRFDLAEAARIARDLFGVAGAPSALRSERDQNVRISTTGDTDWVLKLSNEGEDPAVVEMENAAIAHIAAVDPSLPVPLLRPAITGETTAWVDGDGRHHLARMVSWMPGTLRAPAELDHRELEQLGLTLARLGHALRGFFHPAVGRVLQWDLKHATDLRPLLPHVEHGERRELVTRTLDRWEAEVAPRFARLRAQAIHGDLSVDNALFADDGSVAGIVDFGDMSHTALLCDLSASLASVVGGREDSLAAAAAVVRGYERATPLEPLERELLPFFLAMRIATSQTIAAWRVKLYPENGEYITADNARFWPLLEELDAIGPEEAARRLRWLDTRASTEALASRRRRVFGPAMQSLTYDRPIRMTGADGVWMFDGYGHRYLDAYNNVPVVGHSHPRVLEAAARQAERLNTNMRYLHPTAIELAERLLATVPPEIDTCLLVNSGSEANDLAWRIVTTVTGRGGGIVTDFAYHGVTTVGADLSPEEWGERAPPPHVARIPAPDGYRGAHRRETDGWADRYVAHLDEAAAELGGRGFSPAVVMIDSGFTSDGILDPPASYLTGIVERTHACGARFVADEVQAGHGRTGEHLWSFAAAGMSPDIVTLGKPMGNGFPVAAVLMRSDLAAAMAENTTYFSTFGGNPVACAASLAVLDVIDEEGLLEHTALVGAYLRGLLEELARRHEAIGEVRGRGLLLAVELVQDRDTRAPDTALARAVVNELRARGVLVGLTGRESSALKIRPPLVLQHEHAELLATRLDEALSAVVHR